MAAPRCLALAALEVGHVPEHVRPVPTLFGGVPDVDVARESEYVIRVVLGPTHVDALTRSRRARNDGSSRTAHDERRHHAERHSRRQNTEEDG